METLEARFSSVTQTLLMIDIFSFRIVVGALVLIVLKYVRKRKKSLKEVKANVLIGMGNIVLEALGYGLIFIVTLYFFETLVPWKIDVNAYTWILALIVADLSYYWMHRIEHKVRVFWTLHSVHHSSTEFNITTSLRLAWLEGLIEWIFFVPMILLGFDLVQVIVSILVVVAYQTWIHTEKIGKLGILDLVLNTPSVHRVHHGSNTQYLDKNFGGILMVWDHLFGTYQKEEEQVNYGLVDNIQTSDPVQINFIEWQRLFKDIAHAKSLQERWLWCIKPPGWRPT